MKLLIVLSTLLFAIPFVVVGQINKPALPQSIRSTLDSHFQGWRFSQSDDDVKSHFADRLPSAQPNLITGDFDGNRQVDFAMLVEHKNFNEPGKTFTHLVETLVFLKKGVSYKLIRLQEPSPSSPEFYLTLARKGDEGQNLHTEKRFRYPNDSISTWFFEKAGGTYIWKKGRFIYITESD